MGTSKTKIGRTDSNKASADQASFKTAKMVASKYFSGNVSAFATTMKTTISAIGVDYFISEGAKRKATAFAKLVSFVIIAANSNIKEHARKIGINTSSEEDKPRDILFEYVNNIYPNAITDEDIFAREQLLFVANDFASLFDEDGYIFANKMISEQLIKNIILKDLVKELFDDYISISPGAIENDTPNIVENKIASAKADIRVRLNKFKNVFSFNINDCESILQYRINLKKSVISEYFLEVETNE